MGKVGRFINDPKAGAYCDVTLDNGDKVVVHHEKGGFQGGRLTVEKTKWMGRAALARLIQGIALNSARATPLGAFAEYVKDCKSAADARMKLAAPLTVA